MLGYLSIYQIIKTIISWKRHIVNRSKTNNIFVLSDTAMYVVSFNHLCNHGYNISQSYNIGLLK